MNDRTDLKSPKSSHDNDQESGKKRNAENEVNFSLKKNIDNPFI